MLISLLRAEIRFSFPDLAAEHAIGGIIGLLFNALFADKDLIALDGVNTTSSGGWINHNWKQLYIQFTYICAAVGIVSSLPHF